MSRKKIFISAYACEPGKGSEVGVGWHWVLELSKYYELWVLTRANNQIPIEEYFVQNPQEDRNIHFLYYDLPLWIKRLKKGMRGVRTYYALWQWGSNPLVRDTMRQYGIPNYHLLTYGNALWPVSGYGKRQTFVWGPTGGMDVIPREYSRHYTFRNQLVELARWLLVKLQKINPAFRSRCACAALILCKAESMLNAVPEKYRYKAKLFTDVAMEKPIKIENQRSNTKGEQVQCLCVGRLDGWRGFDLLLEAFAKAIKVAPYLRLSIMGSGSEKKHICQKIEHLQLGAYVTMLGQLTMREYNDKMEEADIVINPCLKEGAVTNAFDCMRFAKPLLCVDTGGYTRNLSSESAIIVPRGSREEVINGLTQGLCRLCSQEERKRLAKNIQQVGTMITWEIKGKQIYDLMELVTQ